MTPPHRSPILVRMDKKGVSHNMQMVLEFKNSCAYGAKKRISPLHGYGGAG